MYIEDEPVAGPKTTHTKDGFTIALSGGIVSIPKNEILHVFDACKFHFKHYGITDYRGREVARVLDE